jgi:hypothetical protein
MAGVCWYIGSVNSLHRATLDALIYGVASLLIGFMILFITMQFSINPLINRVYRKKVNSEAFWRNVTGAMNIILQDNCFIVLHNSIRSVYPYSNIVKIEESDGAIYIFFTAGMNKGAIGFPAFAFSSDAEKSEILTFLRAKCFM